MLEWFRSLCKVEFNDTKTEPHFFKIESNALQHCSQIQIILLI